MLKGLLAGAMIVMAACATTSARQTPSAWTFVTEAPATVEMRAGILPPFALVRFNKSAFDALIASAGLESDPSAAGVVITLPMPDSTFERFLVKESPTLDPALAKAFPTFRTWSGQGLDDKTATTRFGWTSAGFHAIVLTGTRGSVYIDTYAASTLDLYVVYTQRH